MHNQAPSATVGAMLAPPSPLPWLQRYCRHCRCCHCHCHCYGCRHLHHHQHRFCCHCYHFLVDCCLSLRCLCFDHRCLPSRLPLLAADAIATVVAAANRCPLTRDCVSSKYYIYNNILNIFAATFWLIVVCPRAASAFATTACPRRCTFTNLLVVVVTCAATTVSRELPVLDNDGCWRCHSRPRRPRQEG